MERILKINAPSVVAEIIDSEAVIMDLASGHYFSTQHVGCDIWRGVEHGASRSAILRSLLELYEVDEAEAVPALDAFVRDLLERKLIVESDVTASLSAVGNGSALPPETRRRSFAAPVLNAYADMEDLLLLDPIHDVDEAGWPMPKPPDGSP